MSPLTMTFRLDRLDFPRVSGDEPAYRNPRPYPRPFSPRERG